MKKGFVNAAVRAICLLVASFSLIACSSAEKADQSPLAGSWESVEVPGSYYTFKEDGTGTFFVQEDLTLNCTYTVTDNKVEILWEGNSTPQVCVYEISGDQLTFTDQETGQILKYTKK